MTDAKRIIELNMVQYYLGVIVLVLSVVSSVSSIGYFVRQIGELDARVASIEAHGSVSAQLAAKDIQWQSESMKRIEAQLDRLENKIDKAIVK